MATHQITPPPPAPCPECGAGRITAEAVSTVRLIRPGTALPGISGPVSECWALVCPQCGHTTLYAKDPGKLRES
ncbi:MAG: hypothetical protein ACHQ1E_06565 [Ktedonobacterales bacterium]